MSFAYSLFGVSICKSFNLNFKSYSTLILRNSNNLLMIVFNLFFINIKSLFNTSKLVLSQRQGSILSNLILFHIVAFSFKKNLMKG